MIETLVTWIEAHPATVDILKWSAVIAATWLVGGFGVIRRLTRSPALQVYGPAGFCFIEEYLDKKENRKATLALFVLNPAIKNPTERVFEIDRFFLGYDCPRIFRRFRQKLFHVSFPERPRKKFGEGIKVLPVFMTRFPDEFNDTLTVGPRVDARSMSAGYVMFVSNTWGSWAPRVQNDMVKVEMKVTTIGEGTLRRRAKLRVWREPKLVREFCPSLYEHVKCEELWNLEKE